MELFSKSKDIFFSNFNNICRTCIKTKTEEPLHHIFDSEIVILNECIRTSEVLSAVSSLKMQPDDDLPKSVCIQCLDSLTKAYNFRKMCILSDLCMRSAILPNEPQISPKKVQTNETTPKNNSQSDVGYNSSNQSLITPTGNQSGIKILYSEPLSSVRENITKLDEISEHKPCMQRAIIPIKDENISKAVSMETLAALSDPSYSVETSVAESGMEIIIIPSKNKSNLNIFPTKSLATAGCHVDLSSKALVSGPCIQSTILLNEPQIISEKLPTLDNSMALSECNQLQSTEVKVLDSYVQGVIEPNGNKTIISSFPTESLPEVVIDHLIEASVLEQCTQTSNISSQDNNSIKILSNESLTTGSNLAYHSDETGVFKPTMHSPMSVSVAESRTTDLMTDYRSQEESDEENISSTFDEDGDTKISYEYDAEDKIMIESKSAIKEETVVNEEICNKNKDSINVKKEGEEEEDKEEEDKEEEFAEEVKEKEEEVVEEFERKEDEKEVGLKSDTTIQEIEKPNPRNKRNGCYTCDICGKTFDRQHRLNRHTNLHKKEGKPFECELCKKRFTQEAFLQRHFITHEKSFLEKTEQQNNSNGYQCPECPRKFLKQQSMASHMQTHSKKADDSKRFKCEICSKMFERLYRLTRHKKLHEENRKYSCDMCDKKFGLSSRLIDHLNSHSGIKPHICHVCEKSFQQACSLKDHLRTHTGEQPFLCAECGKAFNNSSNLRQHQLRHTGVKSFQCPECPSKFTCRSGLFSHRTTHRNVKPFVCNTCGSKFTKNYSLKKHERIHTGEKPYKCDYCEMRFNSSDHMKRHRRIHTGEKPYGCDYCERKFAQSNDMIKHLRSHLGENVYKCNECDASFRLNSELKKHISEHYQAQLKKGKSTQKIKSKAK